MEVIRGQGEYEWFYDVSEVEVHVAREMLDTITEMVKE